MAIDISYFSGWCFYFLLLDAKAESIRVIEWNICFDLWNARIGYGNGNLRSIILIASSVGFMSGAAMAGPMQIVLTLIVLYLITPILTELLSNAATIVIMDPFLWR